MGVYADEKVMKWWKAEYPKHCDTKLDMGKSCVRFKKVETIPFDLIADLATKFTPESWIALYEKQIKKK